MAGEVLQFPIRLGLAEDANPKAPPMSSLKAGANVRWTRDGQIGKRLGTDTMTTDVDGPPGEAYTLDNVKRFITRGRELCVTDGHGLYRYDPVEDMWIGDGAGDGLQGSEVGAEWWTLIDEAAGIATSDVAISGDMLVHAYVTGDPTTFPEATPQPSNAFSLFVQVFNWRSRQLLMSPVRLTAASSSSLVFHVRVLVAGGFAFVLYSADDGVIYSYPIELGLGFELQTRQAIISDLQTSSSLRGRFDALVKVDGDFVVAYERDVGASSNLAARKFTRSTASLSSASVVDLTDDSILSISICEAEPNARIYILYCHDNGSDYRVRYRAIDHITLASSLSPVTIEAHQPGGATDYFAWQVAIHFVEAETLLCAWSGVDQASPEYPSLHSTLMDHLGAEFSDMRRMSSAMALASRVFTLGSRKYVFAIDSRYGERYALSTGSDFILSPSISSYVIELPVAAFDAGLSPTIGPPHRFVAKVDHDIASPLLLGLLPQVAQVDSSTAIGVVPFQATAAQMSFNVRVGLRAVRASIDPDLIADPWRNLSIGAETYIGGAGRVSAWDGRTVFDYGMRTPYIQGATIDANGSMANGSYIYQFEPGFRSRAAVLHRGPMSVAYTIPGVPNAGRVSIGLAPHSIDGKQTERTGLGLEGHGGAFRKVFRSEANSNVLYQLTYEPRYNVFPNDPDAHINAFVDMRDDADINDSANETPTVPAVALGSRPQPYTATGELEDCQPPAPYTLHYFNGRIFTIAGDRRTIWYTKDFREDPGIAPGFNPSLVEVYDQDLTAISSMDEKRLVFWERGFWYVVGDGPTAAGTDNRFSPPQAVQTDVGCTNPRSVVQWPGGVAFQCGNELHNVSRSLEVTWLGKDARDKLEAHPVISSAVLVEAQNEIRFTCNDEAATAGIVLAYDYVRNTWMTRSYLGGEAITDAILHNGVYYMATATKVLAESTSSHLDDGQYVPSDIRLAPIAPAGPIAWHRVKRAQVMGTSVSNHQLTISIARDFSSSTQQTKTFVAGSDTTTVGPLERAQIDLAVQKVQAVEIRISDAAPANANAYPLGNGAGFTLDGVALLVQSKRGLPRITPSRRG